MKSIFTPAWRWLAAVALIAGLGACSSDDTEPSLAVKVPDGGLTFGTFSLTPQTITVDASTDWTFEVSPEGIFEVTRSDDNKTLSVSPVAPNYDNTEATATVAVKAGSQTAYIALKQSANAATFLRLNDAELTGDHPILIVETGVSDDEGTYEIPLLTNHTISIRKSTDQTLPATDAQQAASTRANAIEGVDWLTYDLNQEITEEGPVTTLVLRYNYYDNQSEQRHVNIDIVANASGEGNSTATVSLSVVQMADTPTIIINPTDGLQYDFDPAQPQTVSVAANVDYSIAIYPETSREWITVDTENIETSANGKVKTYKVTVAPNYDTRSRAGGFYAIQQNASGEPLRANVTIQQDAAPNARVSIAQKNIIFGAEDKEKLVEVTSTFGASTKCEVVAEDDQPVDWMTAEYNADAQLVSLKPVGALPSRNRTATLKVSCGASDNIATATATVTQLGTEPTLVLDPDHLVIDQQGTAQVVTVLTNQSSWSIDQASVPSWATVTTDAAKNTITVSAQAFNTTGSREFTLKVKAGDLTAELPAVQALTYQVGDIFYKDGKALGVVYETSDNGMHGKVFSFKTYNMSDKILTTTGYTTIPTSETDGLANQEAIRSNADWQTNCPVEKYIYDISAEDGVNWYLPAIEELKALVSYMSGGYLYESNRFYADGTLNLTPFMWTETQSGTGYEITDRVYSKDFNEATDQEDFFAARPPIRELYKKYTDDQYYCIFQPSYETIDETGHLTGEWDNGDERYPMEIDDNWNIVTHGDGMGFLWYSSTCYDAGWGTIGNHRIAFYETLSTVESWYTFDPNWPDDLYNSGSVHPIMQF